MAIDSVLRIPTSTELDVTRNRLVGADVIAVIGSCVNAAGLHLAKTVPTERLDSFALGGLGASPTWNVFCIDGAIAFTDVLGVVGDMRMRLDVDALHPIGDGLAWAPTEFFDQHGHPLAVSARGTLRRIQAELEAAGFDALVGHELEFVLTACDGEPYPRHGWTPYGLAPLLDHEAFLKDLIVATTDAGIPLEQVHAEYAAGQLELSLPPASPIAAADNAVLARLLVARVARRHGLAASFSPFPFAGGGGNGAHQHFSLTEHGTAIFSGGTGPHGLTDAGGAAIAGVLDALPGIQGVLSGSVLSSARLQPGFWSGAYACWGLENREAAVRLIEGTAGNPHGANVEVKIADPSANPYLATAAILGAAVDGIRSKRPLPEEVTVNPAELDEAARRRTGTVELASTLTATIDALAASGSTRRILGSDVVDSVLAVRRHELAAHGDASLETNTAAFRFAWSS